MQAVRRCSKRLFCISRLGNIAPNRLQLNQLALVIEYGAIGPLLPPSRTIRKHTLVDSGREWRFRREAPNPFLLSLPIRFRNERPEARANQLIVGLAEHPAIGLIDKCASSVRPPPNDHLALVFDNRPK